MNNKDIIKKAVQIAIAELQNNCLSPGLVLAHSDDAITFEFVSLEGEYIVGRSPGRRVRYLRSEVFDVNRCKAIALNLQAQARQREN